MRIRIVVFLSLISLLTIPAPAGAWTVGETQCISQTPTGVCTGADFETLNYLSADSPSSISDRGPLPNPVTGVPQSEQCMVSFGGGWSGIQWAPINIGCSFFDSEPLGNWTIFGSGTPTGSFNAPVVPGVP